jgi:hypothetical protein
MGPRGDKKKGREFKPIRGKHYIKHVNIVITDEDSF